MNEVIAWATFAGAWLLVAGPLYQGSVELGELDFDREGVEGIKASAVQVAQNRPSPWWWLLPPVAYVKQYRRQREYRRQVFEALTPEQVEGFVEFSSVATGWSMVAAGAFFIAVKETYEVVELYEWPLWLFVALLVVMLAACTANTVVRVRRAHQLLGAQQPTDPPSPAS